MTAQRLASLRQLWVYDMARADGHPVVGAIHSPELCEPPCAYHSPSDHPLRDAPMGLTYVFTVPVVLRACVHDVWHPDPDSLLHLARIGVDPVQHACCDLECCQ